MVQEFITVDDKALRANLQAAERNLRKFGEQFARATSQAMIEQMEDWVSQGALAAPVEEGTLRASGTTTGPTRQGDEVVVTGGFNVAHATIRDQGGVIKPVRAKALFIPLRKGARPGDKSLKLGVDFMLIPGPTTNKTEVRQRGTHYFSGVIEKEKARAAANIARRAAELMKSGFGRG